MRYGMWALGLAVMVGGFSSGGCAVATGSHTMLDTAELLPPNAMKSVADVQVFKVGTFPKASCVPTAGLVANGNAYAEEKDLMDALKLEAFRVRANILFINGEIKTTSMAVGTYGGGIALADTVTFPYMQGLACRTGQVWHGVRFQDGKKHVVKYVYDGSPGQKAGIKEGDELLTLNGAYMDDDEHAWSRYIGAGQPQAAVAVGLMRAGVKHQVVMTLERP